jgi:hypothetical protein
LEIVQFGCADAKALELTLNPVCYGQPVVGKSITGLEILQALNEV